jgi:hypothetical protein
MITAKSLPPASNPAEALAAVIALRLMADRWERNATPAALDTGWSWTEIAEALGVTKQAAHKRFAQLCQVGSSQWGETVRRPPSRRRLINCRHE